MTAEPPTLLPLGEDGYFEVHLQRTGRTVTVGRQESILGAIQAAGLEVPFSCAEGVCGTCLTKVLAGRPDHWDTYLTREEQDANNQMLICCSRSLTARLVLDL
ncbi:MAG: 2Fe-2S iron-sulfur cluster-binding protein [Burkholderiaceae bacterium]